MIVAKKTHLSYIRGEVDARAGPQRNFFSDGDDHVVRRMNFWLAALPRLL
jgi:hypothetical protein